MSVSPVEARFLANLVTLLACDQVLEVGTGFGYSTTWLARGVSLCGAAGNVCTVDDFAEGETDGSTHEVALELWRRTGVQELVTLVRGSSPEALDDLAPLSASMAFIDGHHYGDAPSRDYYSAKRHLRENGCIVFHDVHESNDVGAAVEAAEADGFTCIALPSSCRPVVALQDAGAVPYVRVAFELAMRRLVAVGS